MIWFRVAVIVVVAAVVVLAVTRSALSPASPPPTPTASEHPPTPTVEQPTRVALPTLAPQAIISRVSRVTPEPPPRSTPPATPRVAAVDYAFSPRNLVVQLGASVMFVNDGSDGHDVTGTGPGGDWRSGPLAPSERYSRQFGLPGTYAYVCSIHPEMRGSVVVQP